MKAKDSKEVQPKKQTPCNISLPFHPDRKVVARFDGGNISSDAGLLPFYALDQQNRFSSGMAACILDSRDSHYIRHQMEEMLCQRSHQIVAGYEDCNDANWLRSDPIFKTICNRLPESDPDLASQPTLSRLENSVTRKDLLRIGRWFVDRYVKQLKKRGPKKVVLDLDSTDDPTHGQQEFTFYHGYFNEYMYHPLLIFDAETGELISGVLRPGNKGAAAQVLTVLKRLVRKIRQRLGRKHWRRSKSGSVVRWLRL
ncbi:IS1380 family transposase [Acidobacteria bacterium AH-259-G07]|nr:IS1380 family transposase [Acidobacteria bacterium AH-259-G07]